MISVFYDLETSDLNRVGQILNFAFLALDSQFNELETLTSTIKISRLQLPRAGAILTNRTNVLTHQESAPLTESEAAQTIIEFLIRTRERSDDGTVALIGYNSADFDLPFLRTVLARNGYNPYLGQIFPRDLLLVARHLMAFDETFRSQFLAGVAEHQKPSLRLELLCRHFKLLEGTQDHESLADVRLTIELAKLFASQFGVDVRDFEPYEIKRLHKAMPRSCHTLAEPLRSPQAATAFRSFPATLLDADKSSALWINLEKFSELQKKGEDTRGSIVWCKYADHTVRALPEAPAPEFCELANVAHEDLKGITVKTFFTEKTCDIEQHIYRIPPSGMDLLHRIIHNGESFDDLSPDIRHILKRHWIENYTAEPTEIFIKALRGYARYRYGGKLILRGPPEAKTVIHPTLAELFREIEELSKKEDRSAEDHVLLTALREFYKASEIYQTAGELLMTESVPGDVPLCAST